MNRELVELLGQDLAGKIEKIEIVYKQILSTLPHSRFQCGYGWDEVHRVQKLELQDDKNRMEIAMRAAISLVLNISYDSTEKIKNLLKGVLNDNT